MKHLGVGMIITIYDSVTENQKIIVTNLFFVVL